MVTHFHFEQIFILGRLWPLWLILVTEALLHKCPGRGEPGERPCKRWGRGKHDMQSCYLVPREAHPPSEGPANRPCKGPESKYRLPLWATHILCPKR